MQYWRLLPAAGLGWGQAAASTASSARPAIAGPPGRAAGWRCCTYVGWLVASKGGQQG